ncbi:hypothetical protein ACUR5C_13650 [Aliikangiella sp. IMCC44653]
MNSSEFDHYNLIISGNIVRGFELTQVKQAAQALFGSGEANIDAMLNGHKQYLKRDIPHAKAYAYQEKLLNIGIEASIERIKQVEPEKNFQLVPEGEEKTSYAELQQKFASGELIECPECQFISRQTQFCGGCGAQLSEDDPNQQPAPRKSRFLVWLTISLILVVITCLAYYYR